MSASAIEPAGIRLCPDVASGIVLPEKWIARTPEELKFVVRLREELIEGQCGPYENTTTGMTGIYLPSIQQAVVIEFIEVETGNTIRQTKIAGAKVDCPYRPSTESLAGAPVPEQLIQGVMINALSPLPAPRTWNEETYVFANTLSTSGELLALGSGDGLVNVWDVNSGVLLRAFQAHPAFVSSVAFSPDASLLAAGFEDGTVKVWDREKGTIVFTLKKQKDRIEALVFSSDGLWLASGSHDTARLWDVTARVLAPPLDASIENVSIISFSPDGKLLALVTNGETILFWDLVEKTVLRTLDNEPKGIGSIEFSPDGKLLASGSWDGTIQMWDVATGSQLYTLTGHVYGVGDIAFAPDGKSLGSASGDGMFQWWDLERKSVLRTIIADTDRNYGYANVAFTANGELLASYSDGVENMQIFRGELP